MAQLKVCDLCGKPAVEPANANCSVKGSDATFAVRSDITWPAGHPDLCADHLQSILIAALGAGPLAQAVAQAVADTPILSAPDTAEAPVDAGVLAAPEVR